KARTLLTQDALHAANGVALAVKQMPNAAQEIDVIGPIVAAPTRPLHRTDLRKATFPEAQHVLRQIEIACHFADCAERIGRFVQSGLPSRALTRAIMDLRTLTVCVDPLLEDR